MPESAPVLPYTSVILSKEQEPDDWLPGGVGEVAGAERTTTLARAPNGLAGAHVCGSATDFNLGGTTDESLPPVRFSALGFPLCCFPPRRVRGGAGASAPSVVGRIAPVAFRGGAGCSGRSAYAVEPGSVPGDSCATAAPIAVGELVSAHHPGGSVAHWWFVPFASTGVSHRIIGSADPDVAHGAVRGGDCPNPAQFYEVDWTGCFTILSFAPGEFVYVTSSTGAAFDYSFVIEAGACP